MLKLNAMKEKKYQWHKVADSIDDINFPSNSIANIEVAGKSICVALHRNNLSAFTQKCPHAGGNLSNGFLDAQGNIVCPLHRYKFSVQNGRNTSGEGYFLKTFPIQIRKEGIFIGFEENNFFNWLK
jgi:3-phenylpropionate/trans-cinnamate dioxygenase ferredoxin subunit